MKEQETYNAIIGLLEGVLESNNEGLQLLRQYAASPQPGNNFWSTLQNRVLTSTVAIPQAIGEEVCSLFFRHLLELGSAPPANLTPKLKFFFSIASLYFREEEVFEKTDFLLHEYKKIDNPLAITSMMVFLGDLHIAKLHDEIGLTYLKEAQILAEKYKFAIQLGECYSLLANYYFAKGEYGQAYEQYLLALTLWQQEPLLQQYPIIELILLQNMAMIHVELEQNDLAYERFAQVEELAMRQNMHEAIIHVNINRCTIARRWKDVDMLKECIRKIEDSLKFQPPLGKLTRSFYEHKLGDRAFLEKNYDVAIEKYLVSLDFARAADSPQTVGMVCCSLAETYIEAFRGANSPKSLEAAQVHLEAAEEALRSIVDSKILPRVYKLYADLYDLAGNFEKAYLYHKLYDEKNRKVNNLLVQERSKIHDATKTLHLVQREKRLIEEKNKELQEAHTKLLRQQKQLEQQTREIAFINSELLLRNDELEQLNAQKDTFLRIAAHDLKNPISGIILSVESMRLYKSALALENLDEQLGHISLVSQRMLRIIDSLLLYNKVETTQMQIIAQEFDVADTISHILSEFSAQSIKKNIAVNVSCPSSVVIHSDEHIIIQILDNLLSNAIKFSPPSSTVYLSVDMSVDNNRLVISIADEGPGFSAEDREKLFQPFVKLSARPTAGEHSSGLGLAIVFHLVKALGGSIELLETDKGAHFRLNLPCSFQRE